jgi:hypothetical protein
MGRTHTSLPASDEAHRAGRRPPLSAREPRELGAESDRAHGKLIVASVTGRRFGALRAPRAPSVLGDDHPLSRNTILVHRLAVQATATSSTVLIGVLAATERRSWGVRLLAAAILVELTLVAMLALARQTQREHVLRLIASGGQRLRLEEVSREVDRLAGPRYSAQLARRLERALEDAIGWYQIPIASRPPPGMRLLAGFAEETREIVAQLRAGPAAVPGLALLELMLTNSYESALYADDRDALRDQLSRVHQLMGRSSEPSPWGERNHQRPRPHELASVLGIVADRARRTDGQP